MKTKSIIISGIVFLIVIASIVSFVIYRALSKNNDTFMAEDYSVEDDCTEEEYMYEMGMFEKELEASSAEEKISPNASLIIEKKFKECGHITTESSELPTEMVNKTQEEIENIYKEFKVESFSSNEIVLYKEVEGLCNEHYKIKEEDGVIVIYVTNEKGEEILYDKTGVSTEYLTQSDLDNIRNGLEIYGKENLNKFIEDFE